MQIILPPLAEYTRKRPYKGHFEEDCLIPSEDYVQWWEQVYTMIRAYGISSPVKRNPFSYINPSHGFFGFRTHPVTNEENYFHTGIALEVKSGRKIFPVLPGILEYAGYGAVNGHYVLLSHPEIQTEDGYIMHSMYCHLKKPLVKFNSYQKMLRKISLGSHPLIPIDKSTLLGNASVSGLVHDQQPILYLQISFRKFGQPSIMIDPLQCYHKGVMENNSKKT